MHSRVLWHTLQEYLNSSPYFVAYPSGVHECIPAFCGISSRSTWMHPLVLWHTLQEYTNASPYFVAYPPGVHECIPVFCGIPSKSTWMHPRVLWHTLQEYLNTSPCFVAYPTGVSECIPVFCGDCVAQSLVFCIIHCIYIFILHFGFSSPLIYVFWVRFWHLQTFHESSDETFVTINCS